MRRKLLNLFNEALKLKNAYILLIFVCCSSYAQQAPEFAWAKQLGGKGMDVAHSIVLDKNNHVYTTGFFTDTADFDPGPGAARLISKGGNNIFVSKLDVQGNYEWAVRMGSSVWADERGHGIAVDDSGYVYVAGYFGDVADFGSTVLTSSGDTDIFIAKLDSSGNFIWAKSMGGRGQERAEDIAVDALGNVYITGRFSVYTADFNPDPNISFTIVPRSIDIFVAKLDANGNFVWAKSMGGSGQDIGSGIAIDSGFVYITGSFSETADFDPGPDTFNLVSNGIQDIFIAKLDTAGSFVWAKGIGGSTGDWGNKIAVDGEGNVYTTGQFRTRTDFDPGPDSFYLTPASQTILWGSSTITVTDNTSFVSKLNAEGNFVWAISLGGKRASNGMDINVDKVGNVYAVGIFTDSIDFDPGPGTYILTSTGTLFDAYIFKLSPEGSFFWAKSFEGNQSLTANSIAINSSGHVFTTGNFQQPFTNFNPGPDSFVINSYGGNDVFVHKLVCLADSFPSQMQANCNGYTIGGVLRTEPGTYAEILTGHSGCDSVLMIDLEIFFPEATISVDENILSTQSFKSYQWFLNGVPVDGATDSFLVVTENGNYTVVITDSAGCVGTSEAYSVTSLNIIDVNNRAQFIYVYPNPSDNVIYINSPLAVKVTLSAIDGRTIFNAINVKTIPVKDMADGVYLLNISDTDGRLIKVEKVIITH